MLPATVLPGLPDLTRSDEDDAKEDVGPLAQDRGQRSFNHRRKLSDYRSIRKETDGAAKVRDVPRFAVAPWVHSRPKITT